MIEVTGPDRAARRAKGKDDALDAVAAAEAARGGLVSVRFVFFLVGVLALLVVAVMLW